MDKNEAIKIAADILQSVYSRQTRLCHETLAECIIDAFLDHRILDVEVPDYRDYKFRSGGLDFIRNNISNLMKDPDNLKLTERCQNPSMDCPGDTYNLVQGLRSLQ